MASAIVPCPNARHKADAVPDRQLLLLMFGLSQGMGPQG